jgi:hypothetical protein
MATSETIARVVSLLCEAYGRKPTEATFSVYKLALSDVTDAELNTAAGRASRECRFMPTPAELRQLAGCATNDDRAVLAWAAVERSFALGPYRHVSFDDGCINATIRNLGGWPTFLARLTDAEAEKWLRKEFLATYAALSRVALGDEEMAALPGLAEVQVVQGKLGAPVPSRIECKTGRVDRPLITARAERPRLSARSGQLVRIGESVAVSPETRGDA